MISAIVVVASFPVLRLPLSTLLRISKVFFFFVHFISFAASSSFSLSSQFEMVVAVVSVHTFPHPSDDNAFTSILIHYRRFHNTFTILNGVEYLKAQSCTTTHTHTLAVDSKHHHSYTFRKSIEHSSTKRHTCIHLLSAFFASSCNVIEFLCFCVRLISTYFISFFIAFPYVSKNLLLFSSSFVYYSFRLTHIFMRFVHSAL